MYISALPQEKDYFETRIKVYYLYMLNIAGYAVVQEYKYINIHDIDSLYC